MSKLYGPPQPVPTVGPPAPAYPLPQTQRQNPNKAYWRGLLDDVSIMLSNPGRGGLSGLASKYQAAAEGDNAALDAELYRRYSEQRAYELEAQKAQDAAAADAAAAVQGQRDPAIVAEYKYALENELIPEGTNWEEFYNMRANNMYTVPYDELDDRNRIEAGSSKMGQISVEQWTTVNQNIPTFNRAIGALKRLRQKVANGKETYQTVSQIQALIDPELQVIRALMTDQLFGKISSARAAGATFGQMTVAEWEILRETIPNLSTRKSANLEILDDLIRRAEMDLSQAKRFTGSFNPGDPIPSWSALNDAPGGGGNVPGAPQSPVQVDGIESLDSTLQRDYGDLFGN